jgi:hypothetical protein
MALIRSITGSEENLKASRLPLLLCIASGTAFMMWASAAAQSDDHPRPKPFASTPIPPARPADLTPNAIPSTPPAPRLQTQPTSAPASIPSTIPHLSKPAPMRPHDLPVASRSQMHACGIEWQQMKAAGQTSDLTWRDFAQGCLAHQER